MQGTREFRQIMSPTQIYWVIVIVCHIEINCAQIPIGTRYVIMCSTVVIPRQYITRLRCDRYLAQQRLAFWWAHDAIVS